MILSQMREQAEIAIATADVIRVYRQMCIRDLIDADSRRWQICSVVPTNRCVLVVNKVDSFEKYMADVYEFYNLGIGDPIAVSAASGKLGLGDMLDEAGGSILTRSIWQRKRKMTVRRIAIVGKPNVGKSSIINKLTGENRVIVSDIAGTTRDAIDTEVVYHGREYVFH